MGRKPFQGTGPRDFAGRPHRSAPTAPPSLESASNWSCIQFGVGESRPGSTLEDVCHVGVQVEPHAVDEEALLLGGTDDLVVHSWVGALK